MIVLGLAMETRDSCKNESPVFEDAGAALIVNGTAVSRIDAQKLERMKRNTGPLSTVRFVLRDYGIQLKEVDKIALIGTEENSAIGLDKKDNLCSRFHEVFDVTPGRSDIFFINPHLVYAAAMFDISDYNESLFLTFHQDVEDCSLMLLAGDGAHHTLDELDFFPAVDREKFPLEEVVERLSGGQKDFPHSILCITGNTAVPSSLVERIRSAGVFPDIFINPVKQASARALGAGLYLYDKETSTLTSLHSQVKYEAYRDETERILTEIWQEILSKEKIGINDDFFQLGGNSLTAIVLNNEIHKAIHKQLPLADIFKYPTIKELSTCLHALPEDRYAAIEPGEKKEYYPLTSAQQRLYIIQQIELNSTAYNLPQMIPLSNVTDIDKLEKAFIELMNRHESFRTSFHMIKDEPAQRIHDEVEFQLDYYDLENNVQGVEGMMENFIKPFDLSRAPLLQVGLVKTGKAKYLLLLDMNHIITDGVSESILERELTTLYSGEKLASLRIQYRDFSGWQHSEKVKTYIIRQEEYWLKEFETEIPVLNLPTDFKRPSIQSFEGSTFRFEISEEDTRALKKYALQEDATLFMALTAVYNIFLYKISGQEDIVIGTALAGRRHPDLEMIIGMFLNTLALRYYPGGEKTLRQFLKEVKTRTLKAFENQDYPFESLVEKVELERDATRNPLYCVMLILQNIDDPSPSLLGQQASHLGIKGNLYEKNISTNDITLYVREAAGKLNFSLEYCTKLFKEDTIKRFVNYFKKIVSVVPNDTGKKISGIEIISNAEKQQLLFEFNHTKKEIVRNKCYRQLFEEKVTAHSNQVAAIHGSTQIIYNKLNEDANRIAHFLARHGIKPGAVIGVYLSRSIHMLASIIGILKMGCAYLPLDKEYPVERIKHILNECDVRVLITDTGNMETVKKITDSPVYPGTVLYLDHQVGIETMLGQYAVKNPGIISTGDDLAYVIYTSGTTGKPKGVMIHQQGMINHLYAKINDLSLMPDDIIAQTASAGFDISVWQFLAGLLVGGCTFIIEKTTLLDPARFLQVLQKGKITVLESVPSLLTAFLNMVTKEKDNQLAYLRWMILTGEALDVHLVRDWYAQYPHIKILNAYGPTEASDDVTHYVVHDIPPGNQETIPIGKPLQNLHIYILDKYLSLCPIGIRGEICAAGLGIGKGYWKDPRKTKEVFIPNPYIDEIRDNDYAVLYKTGDVGYFREDGNVECLGRMDQQVKIRGNRIELGEIESQLLMHEDIKEAVVTVVAREGTGIGGSEPGKYICAYYVPAKEINGSELQDYLSQKLPVYMLPSFFVPIENIPLTPNGKVDKKALPQPEMKDKKNYVPPANEREKKLVALFAKVLDKEASDIGVTSRFFELGGHSLLAMKLASFVKEVFQVKIPLSIFFQDGTARGISRMIENLQHRQHRGQEKEAIVNQGLIIPFDPGQAPLFRVKVIQLQENRYLLFIDMHHIISDGISSEIIADEFKKLYGEEVLTLPDLPIQYKDFARWQNHFFETRAYENQEYYWLDSFNGDIPRLNLPLDYPRPKVRKGKGKTIESLLSPRLAKEIKAFYRRCQATPFMFFLAIYAIFLAKFSPQEDVVVGTPVSGRTHSSVSQLVGVFVNTLALRFKPAENLAFNDFLKKVKANTLNALENQDYPFERLVEKLNLSGSISNTPLFETLFTLDQTTSNENHSHPLKITPYELKIQTTPFDLTVSVSIIDSMIRLDFIYDIDLFKEETIHRLIKDFETLLSRAVHYPDKRIAQLQTGALEEIDSRKRQNRQLSREERHRILEEFNDTASAVPGNPVIHHRFQQQVETSPHHTAVKYQDQSLTYSQLHKKANQLAHRLKTKGVTRGQIVGMMLERSLEMIIGVFAILKAGGVFLPIAPEYPEERVRYTLADSNVSLLLTGNNLQECTRNRCEAINLHDPCLYAGDESEPVKITAPQDPAYVIYTSGTTGNPKGVMVEHHSVVNWICWMQKAYHLKDNDIVFQKTPIVFDVSVRELFWWALQGARVYVGVTGVEKNPHALAEETAVHNITIIHFVPSMLTQFLDYLERANLPGLAALSSLRMVISSGEALTPYHVERFHQVLAKTHQIRLINLYGPTEATVEVAYFNCPASETVDLVPIGKPIDNTHLYIVDEKMELLPVGVPGEICIGGTALARGYVNRPELTDSRFISDPFAQGQRIYKTGDLGNWLPDGNIEFLGRRDYQIKIRGFRIEPAEIETALLKHPAIRKAVVMDREDVEGIKYLLAGIVIEKELTVKQLRTFLMRTLPDYMVPAVFLKLDQIPLTISGKVDRETLEAVGESIASGSQYVPPQNKIEENLANIWSQVLNRSKIGREDNFFELGGDSFRAVLMMAKTNAAFGTVFHLKEIFDTPILGEFSKIFPNPPTTLPHLITPVDNQEQGIYPCSSAQKRLYLLNQLNSEDTSYNITGTFIIEGCPDRAKFESVFRQLQERHESLRTDFLVRDGEIMQRINKNVDSAVEFFEIDGQEPDIEKIINGKIPLRKTGTKPDAGSLTFDTRITSKRREMRRRNI